MTFAWYVAAVQPKSEAFAAVHLRRQGFEVYSPKIMGRKRIDGVAYEMPVPMFPGYLFVHFDRDAPGSRWRSINGTRGVVKLLPLTAELPQALPDGLVEQWLAAEIDGRVVLDEAVEVLARFQPGEVLNVVDGPFEGHPGTCISSVKGRVTLLMGLFGRPTVVELSANEVELVADHGTASAVAIAPQALKR